LELQAILDTCNDDPEIVKSMISSINFHYRKGDAGDWDAINTFIRSDAALDKRFTEDYNNRGKY
jgi:hypothetical protein